MAINNIIYSLYAKECLLNIYEYGYLNWGTEKANLYLTELNNKIEHIKLGLVKGKNYNSPKLKKYNLIYYHYKKHYIIYKVDKNILVITAILNDRMDIEYHLNRIKL